VVYMRDDRKISDASRIHHRPEARAPESDAISSGPGLSTLNFSPRDNITKRA